MARNYHNWARAVFVAMLLLGVACSTDDSQISDPDRLSGTAEDLWGNKIDLASLGDGVTVVSSFSPATCGYCLLDGDFVERNYGRKTIAMGEHYLHQSLFVPQLDVYTFLKHYRCDDVVTLTYPLSLQDYQTDGFPYLFAFRNGERVFTEVISDYHNDYKSFVATMWPDDEDDLVTLASPRKLADNTVFDDVTQVHTYVIPDSRERSAADWRERMAERKQVQIKLEKELTEADLQTHLIFEGTVELFRFDIFEDQQTPIRFEDGHILIGDYRLSGAEFGLTTHFPNPHNREKYILMRLGNSHAGRVVNSIWNDLCIWQYGDSTNPCDTVLEAIYAKQSIENIWQFADSLAVTYKNLSRFCKGGICPLPASSMYTATRHEYDPPSGNEMRLFGNSHVRHPDVAVGDDGLAYVVFEEAGDIILARWDQPTEYIPIETSSFDSFNPLVVRSGKELFVAYLSNRDGWYRLYGHFVRGGSVSPTILVSGRGVVDAITPALVSREGQIYAAWTEWRANSRVPKYRLIKGRTLATIENLVPFTEGTNGYTNAWSLNLAMDDNSKPAAVWNQHYPAIVGVYSGDLRSTATSVTAYAGNYDDSEAGGYASTCFGPDGRQWVVWESFWWDSYRKDHPQQILASYYDDELASWSSPYVLSDEKLSFLNQSPQIVSNDGVIMAAWSGRMRPSDSTWSVYQAYYNEGSWSKPEMISRLGVCSRAPRVAAGPKGQFLVCWHAGVGRGMQAEIVLTHYKARP